MFCLSDDMLGTNVSASWQKELPSFKGGLSLFVAKKRLYFCADLGRKKATSRKFTEA